VKVILRIIATAVILSGVYLIFFEKQFMGIFAIIIGFVLLPRVENRKNSLGRDPDSPIKNESSGSEPTKQSTRVFDYEGGGNHKKKK
jgi:hypothetical protein